MKIENLFGVLIMVIFFVALIPTIVTQIQGTSNVDTTTWNFTGASGDRIEETSFDRISDHIPVDPLRSHFRFRSRTCAEPNRKEHIRSRLTL